MTSCPAIAQSDGSFRCAKCRRAWDRDDENPCPLLVEAPPLQPISEYISDRVFDGKRPISKARLGAFKSGLR